MPFQAGKWPVPRDVPKGTNGIILGRAGLLDHDFSRLALFPFHITVPKDTVCIGPAVIRTVMPPIVIPEDPSFLLGGQGPKIPEIIEKHPRGPMAVPLTAGQGVLSRTTVYNDPRSGGGAIGHQGVPGTLG